MPRRSARVVGHDTVGGTLPYVDVIAPEGGVVITVRPDGRRLWVNVDGMCVLRITNIPYLEIEDNREPSQGGEGQHNDEADDGAG